MVFAFFAFVLWALTTQPDTLLALLVTPIWFVILGVAWFILRKRPSHLARYAEFQKDLAGETGCGRGEGRRQTPSSPARRLRGRAKWEPNTS